MSQARLKHNLQFQALLCISLSINLMSSSSQNGHKKDNLQTFPSRIFQASYQSLYWATELFLNITAKIVNLQTNKGELTRDGTQLKMGWNTAEDGEVSRYVTCDGGDCRISSGQLL